MHTWQVFTFLLFAAACIVAAAQKGWALALLVPVVFSVH